MTSIFFFYTIMIRKFRLSYWIGSFTLNNLFNEKTKNAYTYYKEMHKSGKNYKVSIKEIK